MTSSAIITSSASPTTTTTSFHGQLPPLMILSPQHSQQIQQIQQGLTSPQQSSMTQMSMSQVSSPLSLQGIGIGPQTQVKKEQGQMQLPLMQPLIQQILRPQEPVLDVLGTIQNTIMHQITSVPQTQNLQLKIGSELQKKDRMYLKCYINTDGTIDDVKIQKKMPSDLKIELTTLGSSFLHKKNPMSITRQKDKLIVLLTSRILDQRTDIKDQLALLAKDIKMKIKNMNFQPPERFGPGSKGVNPRKLQPQPRPKIQLEEEK